MNKKNKLFIRIFAGFLAALMILGSSITFIYMIINK